jgi:4-hydroxy-tetrahydrodipicolinate synthase
VQGIHTALVTPFTADGALDLPAYERLCARQIDAGIHGLVACGTTGESPTLTDPEWTAVIEATRRIAAGRVPVTAGIGTNSTRTSVEKAVAAKELGADAGLLVFPYYNKPNPAGLRAHVRAVADVGLQLVLYHVPGRTGQTLPVALLAELAAFPGVVAVKEATGDLRYGGDLIARVTTPILSGDDFTFLPLLALGGTGCISVLSNVAPTQTVAIYERFRAGDVEEAALRMPKLWDRCGFLFSDTNPVPCKAALAELGLCGADPRLPLAPWSGPSPRAILDSALG